MPSLLTGLGIERVDILKVDIEGAELEVFSDSGRWIDCVDIVAIELHDHLKAGCSRALFEGTPGFVVEGRRGQTLFLRKPQGGRQGPIAGEAAEPGRKGVDPTRNPGGS